MIHTDETHDPAAVTWVDGADGHPEFPVQNLPLGIFSPPEGGKRGGIAIGDKILDLGAITGLLREEALEAAQLATAGTLNALFADGNAGADALRRAVFALLTDDARAGDVSPALHDMAACELHLPFAIGDYTDFYTGIHHATNVGKQFRPDNPLLPNYKHVPIGYHGRASSIRPSGGDVRRPQGQRKGPEGDGPVFGPSQRLDYEMEMGIWTSGSNKLGSDIRIAEAADHIAGLCILNDWSARDLQAWEYQPLGPFLAKNFATSISAWIITPEALAPFRIAQAPRGEGDPRPLDYLMDGDDQAAGAFNIDLEASILTEAMRASGAAPFRLAASNAQHLYWTVAQMVAHHTCGGCNLEAGDLIGTGTISAPDGVGSMLELTRGGREPATLPSGETRRFLDDGDEVVFRAYARRDGFAQIGFGECRGRVVGAS